MRTTLFLLTSLFAVTTGRAAAQDVPRVYFSSLPDELVTGDFMALLGPEESLARAVASGDPARRVVAARELWDRHSRRHARAVLALVAGDPLKADGFAALKRDVESSLKPDAVLRELRRGDYKWGAWLAVLRPHGDLVPDLLTALKARPDDRAETVYALGASRDLRALEPLLGLLKDKDASAAADAAQALGLLGFVEVEQRLIESLARDDGDALLWVNACGALARVGTPKALPALERALRGPVAWGVYDTQGAVMQAVVAIERRHRLKPALPEHKPAAVLRGHTGYLWTVAFSPDGKSLMSAGADGSVKLWDPVAGRQTASFPGPTTGPGFVSFAQGGRSLLTAGWGKDKSVRVLDAATGRQTGSIPVEAGVFTSFAASPDGTRLAARGSEADPEVVRLWDVATGKSVEALPDARAAVAFSPDGKLLAVFGASEPLGIRLWDVATRRVVQAVPGLGGVFSPDGRSFASSAFWTLTLTDVRTGKVGWSARGDSRIWRVAFSPDGRTLAACEEYAVRVFDAATGRPTALLKGWGTVAFSPDGKWLASGAEDRNSVLLWDAKALNPPK